MWIYLAWSHLAMHNYVHVLLYCTWIIYRIWDVPRLPSRDTKQIWHTPKSPNGQADKNCKPRPSGFSMFFFSFFLEPVLGMESKSVWQTMTNSAWQRVHSQWLVLYFNQQRLEIQPPKCTPYCFFSSTTELISYDFNDVKQTHRFWGTSFVKSACLLGSGGGSNLALLVWLQCMSWVDCRPPNVTWQISNKDLWQIDGFPQETSDLDPNFFMDHLPQTANGLLKTPSLSLIEGTSLSVAG